MSALVGGFIRTHVVGLIALFVALSGVAYAATALKKNSVGSKQIKDGQVQSKDVKDNGLTGVDIDESSLSLPSSGGAVGGFDNSVLQSRVSGSCPQDQAIRSVQADGTVTCESTGQTGNTAFGTAALTLAPASGVTAIPGLTQTVNAPTTSRFSISTDGGFQTTSGATTGFSAGDILVLVDGSQPLEGFNRRVACANTTGLVSMPCSWGLGGVVSLPPGVHTITVAAAGIGAGSNATVSGDNTSVLQGQLTVINLE